MVSILNSRKSRASTFVGTQIYMSPEMIHSTIGDEKGDLWAYGCIVYEMLVGEYLHIEFDSEQQFEEQLEKRLAIMRQKVFLKPRRILISAALIFSPASRSSIRETDWISITCQSTNSSIRSEASNSWSSAEEGWCVCFEATMDY